MVQQIASAIEEMSATSELISKDIESISYISSTTSSTSGEVLSASLALSREGGYPSGDCRAVQGVRKMTEA